jgi:light-regulated signal transduction histidine kinase (bacteriophytochrome)
MQRAIVEARDAAEASNQELEAFSYSVSHDLRAPLRGIDGFSQALLEDYSAKLDQEAKGYLTLIRAGAQKMGELIDDLIELSRVTRSDLQRTKVDLSRIAREAVDDLRRAEPRRRVDVVIQDGIIVEGDPKLLRVALDNLLGNAWKFTSRQSEARIEFGLSTTVDGRATYFVRDNGAGFDMTYASRLFGPFQRLHSMNEFPGTGIGLATVQRVIRRHGGHVRAEGSIGNGASFFFTL